jgi:Cu/Ag efflux pump CusA
VIGWQAGKIIAGKGRLRGYVLEPMSEKISVASKMLVVVALTGMIFSIIYLCRNGFGGEMLKSLAYPVLKGLIASTAVGYDKFFMTIRWVKA